MDERADVWERLRNVAIKIEKMAFHSNFCKSGIRVISIKKDKTKN